ncbi:alpha/beta hydrolase [Streptomyces sp. NPDC092307]|uniref:alpha/beta hydrolase n=1 Tax=Streptomyces sp. NPDC092307 TaxID=3366013 RepID=UPI003808D178
MASELEVGFRSLDGTASVGTAALPEQVTAGVAVLVHGAGVTWHEGGFFTRLAAGLSREGVSCLRFDLRAHGASGGRAREVTIAGVANDIRAASDHLRAEAGMDRPVHVIAASFSGGAAALHAAYRPQDVDRLVLLNPRLDWRDRYVTSRPYFDNDYIAASAARDLDERGFTEKPLWGLGRALHNEVFYLDLDVHLRQRRPPGVRGSGRAHGVGRRAARIRRG